MYFDVYYSKTIDERDKRKVMSPSKSIKTQTSAANTATNQPSYELSVQELEKLIGDMESGKLSLEETLIAYQRGTELIKKCQVLLEQVEQQIRIFEAE
jgi:exodeoxyribonuclease VII small subunit